MVFLAISDSTSVNGASLLYKSIDYGINWKLVSSEPGETYITALKCYKNIVVYGTYGTAKISVSYDYGETFTHFGSQFGKIQIEDIVIYNNSIIATCSQNYIIKSDNFSGNFKVVLKTGPNTMRRLLVTSSGRIILGTWSSRFYVSDTGGESWYTLPSMLLSGAGYINHIMEINKIVYAFTGLQSKLWFSTDFGTTWYLYKQMSQKSELLFTNEYQ